MGEKQGRERKGREKEGGKRSNVRQGREGREGSMLLLPMLLWLGLWRGY